MTGGGGGGVISVLALYTIESGSDALVVNEGGGGGGAKRMGEDAARPPGWTLLGVSGLEAAAVGRLACSSIVFPQLVQNF